MKKYIFIFLLIFILTNDIFFSQDTGKQKDSEKVNYWMELVKSNNFETCKMVVEKLYTMATNKKIRANDNETMDVLKYLGLLGTEINVTSTTSQDFSYIRMRSVQTLGEIGGDYARLTLIRIIRAERANLSLNVIISCFNSLKKIGDDEFNNGLKAARFAFDYMPKKQTMKGMEVLVAFIECVEALSTDKPLQVVTEIGIIDALEELANEDSKFRIYSQGVRKRARAALAYIMLHTY